MSIRQGGKVIAGNTSGHNVGDVFWTMRKSNTLNGAVMCNGATYDTDDFSGAQCIGELLESGEVPYVSLADYATALTNNGVVGVFGWDGIGTTTFRVPTLQDVFIEAGTAAQIGDFISEKLPNATIQFAALVNGGQADIYSGIISSRALSGYTVYSSGQQGVYRTIYEGSLHSGNAKYQDGAPVQPKAVRYRPMVQLAISVSDQALATCTSVMAQVASNTSAINGADYVIESQFPTALNNYTWYRKYKSGWVEQGGVADYGSAVTDIPKIQVNLPITMSDNRYYTTEMPVRNDQDGQSNGLCAAYVGVFDRHTTYFCVRAYCGNTNERIRLIQWEVKGMAAT